ncbi:MAG: hypothetical protein DBX59_08205 [Bacillota bacterium]|nr:MAG: hypothetical protein DBX59_08205 [Bacillota bacterium]
MKILSVVALALQLVIVIALSFWLSHWVWLALLFRGAGMLLCAYILDSGMNSTYKTLYALLLSAFPLLGIVAYIVMRAGGRAKKSVPKAQAEPSKTGGYAAAKLGGKCGTAEGAEYIESGKKFFSMLLKDIRSAKKFVLLQFYIVKQGELLDELFTALGGCAGRGVKVKFAFDSFGAFRSEKELKALCEKNRVEYRVFNKIGWVLSGGINRRNHGKCAVIDGKIAYVGGVNVGDEYVGKTERFGVWKDGGIRFCGGAVDGVTEAFFAAYNFRRRKKESPEPFYRKKEDVLENGEFLNAFFSVPTGEESHLAEVYKTAIYNAKKSVTISTPYLIPDEGVTGALISAAERGVKVQIVIPAIPDKRAVYEVTLAIAEKLKAHGVSVLKFNAGFLHSKNTIIDGKYLLCGSGNMDYRSLYLHYEIGVFGKCRRLAADAEKDVLNGAVEYAGYAPTLKARAFKIFAPFM